MKREKELPQKVNRIVLGGIIADFNNKHFFGVFRGDVSKKKLDNGKILDNLFFVCNTM